MHIDILKYMTHYIFIYTYIILNLIYYIKFNNLFKKKSVK